MEAKLRSDFAVKSARKLAARFPERSRQLGEAAVRALAADGLAWGTRLGIEERNDLECLIRWMFHHGPQFATGPEWNWARNILEDSELSGDAKILLLRQRLDESET
jgi:hypothetical protein